MAAAIVGGRLAGKRALVTGAGGLLGSDLCRAFAAQGADVVASTRRAGKLDPLLAELRGHGIRAEGVAADMTVPADMDRLADRAWAAFGGLDVVVLSSQPANQMLGDLVSTSDADWHDQFGAIVWGPMRLMRQLGPRLMAQGGGSVITLTSSTGFEPTPGFDAYGLAKAGLWWLTMQMAREWGAKGVRANALQPGLIATAGNVAEHEAMVRRRGMLSRTALDRVGRNVDVLGTAVYLASDESAFVSGQRICVDGGRF